MNVIHKLTPEQEALIPVYREKWRSIALSTEPIDRQKATEAVTAAYALLGKKPPMIIFSDSPYASFYPTFNQMESLFWNDPWHEPKGQLDSQLYSQLTNLLGWNQWKNHVKSQLIRTLNRQLENPEIHELTMQLMRQLESQLAYQPITYFPSETLGYYFPSDNLSYFGSMFDFYISVLNCPYNKKKWSIYQSLAKYCGWIVPFKRVCFICDRPTIISFDNQQRLHALASPAVLFKDGFKVYAVNGVRVPELYGKLHPSQWRADWLLSEKNAEVKRVLIQGIGYDRICQDLQATELDSWQEYTLLKIDIMEIFEGAWGYEEEKHMHLLKMTCPSTRYIHALRVPSDITSAREAISWINWGIDPEEFSFQT
ncbi:MULTISPECIES: DUF6745 domain-containing protein [unclassified Microcoleus]|uniref:DUF6745 domain-containing protein n=1 Tax=unclassified Microcoleus TaxID=2642155 RepID=UPI0026000A26|nr:MULTISPECIES: hypothetical protein [unclassified Microcoleus]